MEPCKKNYELLTPILDIIGDEDYIKLEAGYGMMPLSIDRLYKNEDEVRYAIAHNFIQNGDCMADPDMEIVVNHTTKTVEAKTYQLDSLGVYQEVDDTEKGRKLRIDLNNFLTQWLQNIHAQGYLE